MEAEDIKVRQEGDELHLSYKGYGAVVRGWQSDASAAKMAISNIIDRATNYAGDRLFRSVVSLVYENSPPEEETKETHL